MWSAGTQDILFGAPVGMEVTSSLENNLRYMEVCDIFSIYLSPMVAIIVFSKPT